MFCCSLPIPARSRRPLPVSRSPRVCELPFWSTSAVTHIAGIHSASTEKRLKAKLSPDSRSGGRELSAWSGSPPSPSLDPSDSDGGDSGVAGATTTSAGDDAGVEWKSANEDDEEAEGAA